MLIRPALRTDIGTITRIYNHYVLTSHVTFDTAACSEEERGFWFDSFDGERYQCWVAESDSVLAGYACSQALKAKAAYQTSVEVSIYLARDQGGQGLGRALYQALLPALADKDLHRAYALVSQPNEASMRLHESFGFKPVSRLSDVGRKFDRYWDVVWLELAL